MNDLKQETTDTYNNSAVELAEYFRGIGPRTQDIDLAFELAGNPENAAVIEVGCGDGRDAKDIIQRTENYTGFDISEELIKLAREHVPNANFEVAGALEYQYPENLDIVFAFASLLHLDKIEVDAVLKKVNAALRIGGIFYISLKEKSEYAEEIKRDRFGTRLFYLYNAGVIKEMTDEEYEVAASSRKTIGHTDWFELALRKV